jgi:N-acetyl sugar amidotransferase
MLFRCRRCLYPNTKPDLHFNDEGICSACQAFDKRSTINWKAKEEEFLRIIGENKGKSHDVIVACSGGKDSTWQIIKCLELGLRPLAVTATTDDLSDLGRRNLDNVGRLCDHVVITPNREIRKRISKFALEEVGDISWCEHHLIWSVPAREAVNRNIPVVLYGECPQNEYGAGPQGSEANTNLTKDWIDEFGGLLGLRVSDISEILGIDPAEMGCYRYAGSEGVKALFMGAYFPWDGRANATAAAKHGFTWKQTPVEGNFVQWENLDNHQTGVHDHLRWLKFGYGRTVDVASNHIRRGYLTRNEGMILALQCDGRWPYTYLGKPLHEILEVIGVTVQEYRAICDRFENKETTSWASSPESYRSFSGTSTDASRDKGSTRAVA